MGRMFETPVLPRLAELLEEVREGAIRIPEFQRGYVWSDDQRLRLMDSIWRGIPIGSLLVWRTVADKGLRVRTQIGPCKLPQAGVPTSRGYLVDGVQRVTTLFTALMPFPELSERDEDGRRWPIYFDLEPDRGDDLRFRLRHAHQAVPVTWIPLSCLLDDAMLLEFRQDLVDAGRRDLLQETRRLESRFRDYVVPVVPLVSDDQELVTEAFARVNSQGQDLDEGDMAHALTQGQGFSFNEELATVTERLSPVGWEGIGRRTLIAALKAIWNLDVYKSGTRGLKQKLESREGRALLRALPELLEPVIEVFRTFGVYGPGSLPYSYQFVAVLRAAHHLGAERLGAANGPLRKWFFWTTYNEHFTGMTSGQLRVELERVAALIGGAPWQSWYDVPHVSAVTRLRANAVRSRAAILVMAITGDAMAGDEDQRRLYGASGTDALHRLFADESAYDLENRVLASEGDMKKLRDWTRAAGADSTPARLNELEMLLRRYLVGVGPTGFGLDPKGTLRDRARLLRRIEREFVEELEGIWESTDTND